MIGYYIHHQGRGHLLRARAICERLPMPVTVLTSLDSVDCTSFRHVVSLPADDRQSDPVGVTGSGALHWVPLGDPGLRDRMATISAWIAARRPAAMVVDVSVEVALLARLHGVPVVAMALPGTRTDRPHRLVHDIADALIAAWPRQLYRPEWLRPYEHKTHYVGGITRYSESPRRRAHTNTDRPSILVMAGAGGTELTVDRVARCARRNPRFDWRTLGLDSWSDDPWPLICAADVIVAQAGQGTVADIAAARRPAIIIPAERPFDEQQATAEVLESADLATTLERWPDTDQWSTLVARARSHDPDRWRLWQTRGAADRAASVIAEICRTETAA